MVYGIILTQKWSEVLFRKFNEVRKESISILDRMVKKEGLFLVDMNVVVSGKTLKSAEQNATTISSYWNKGGKTSSIVLAETHGIHQLCFLASLPFGANNEYFGTTDKGRSMFSEQVAQFPVLESDWKGNGKNELFLISKRGQPAGIDIFTSNTNFNGCIFAASGAGKSALLNYMAFSYYTSNARVFILDYGYSYQKLCQEVGGQFIEPDPKKPQSFNPFSEIYNEDRLKDELEFLSTFVYSLGANKNKIIYEQDEKLIKSYEIGRAHV